MINIKLCSAIKNNLIFQINWCGAGSNTPAQNKLVINSCQGKKDKNNLFSTLYPSLYELAEQLFI
jgi:hypothetical protein